MALLGHRAPITAVVIVRSLVVGSRSPSTVLGVEENGGLALRGAATVRHGD